jgi:hypothetical protein
MIRRVTLTSLLCLVGSPALADFACNTGADDDDTVFAKAEQTIAAGREAEGFAMLKGITSFCFDSGERAAKEKRFVALTDSVGVKLGKAAEAAGRYDEAERYFIDLRNATGAYTEADEDRIVMARARAKQSDFNVVATALNRFADRNAWSQGSQRVRAQPYVAARTQEMIAYEKQVRALAQAQGDAMLAAEEKAFAGRGGIGTMFGDYPSKNIETAKAWYELGGAAAGTARANERAVARGDRLMTEDVPDILDGAKRYFEVAGNTAKLAQVRAKAKRLGDAAAAEDQYQRAAAFYTVADMSDQADAVVTQGEAKAASAEKKRKKAFDAGAADLEKELGL